MWKFILHNCAFVGINYSKTHHVYVKTYGTCKRSEGLLYAHIMKNEAFYRGTQCRPPEAVFDAPMEVGLKTSCLPYENILNLLTEEERAAIPASVEQSGENVRYAVRTNTEINEDIYKTQELGNIAVIVTLQQEGLKGNSEGNNAVMMMKKWKTFKKSPTEQTLMRKIC